MKLSPDGLEVIEVAPGIGVDKIVIITPVIRIVRIKHSPYSCIEIQ
jgi:acyl CoA:acetate/3-ketoacid CoA transferase